LTCLIILFYFTARSVEVVQQTKSIEGAKMIAKYFQKMNDYNSAIKFLILSNCHDEAFQLANQHGKMELYGEILVNTIDDTNVRKEDFRSLAMHFESQKNNLLAGKYYFHAKEYQKVNFTISSFIYILSCPESSFLFPYIDFILQYRILLYSINVLTGFFF